MLVLTRRVGEIITIGDDVTVTVLGINSGQVKLGVHAPTDIEVHRKEIFDRIKTEQTRRK